MHQPVDTGDWGPNMLAVSMKQKNGRLSFSFRGWRISLLLLFLFAMALFVFGKVQGSQFDDIQAILAIPARLPVILRFVILPLLLLGALLAFLYNLQLKLDLPRRRVGTHKGFDFISRRGNASFDDIQAFHVEEQGITLLPKTANLPAKPVHAGWDVVMLARPGSGLSDIRFWRTPDKAQALKIAQHLADITGTHVTEGRRKSLW